MQPLIQKNKFVLSQLIVQRHTFNSAITFANQFGLKTRLITDVELQRNLLLFRNEIVSQSH